MAPQSSTAGDHHVEHEELSGVKSALFIKNSTCTNVLSTLLGHLSLLKKPFSAVLKANKTLFPFEDQSQLESLLQSKRTPLFGLASHSKKRPLSLILGRLFSNSVLDMIELVICPTSISPIVGSWNAGSRPLLIFQGIRWESGDAALSKLKNLLVDFWSGAEGEKSVISLQGIQHAIVLTADDTHPTISWNVLVQGPGNAIKDSEFSFKFTIGRTHFAPEEVQKKAIEKRISTKLPKKEKNVHVDPTLGDKFGTVHVPRQDFSSLQVRKVKALKKQVAQ
ncbi:rRNA-binding ribosome biosynthesis protein rpf2 [Mitosporidium daphniae]